MASRTPSGLFPSVLEVHLLGPFRVVIDGQAVEEGRWSRRKPALLIKLLALQPHHQLHREQAIEILWPDSDPESAINNLHKVIHQSRLALEPALKSAATSHFILTQGQRVLLRAPGKLWVDVNTEDAEAYQLYLKGSYFWNKRTLEAVKKSIEYFRRAIEIDQHYALAYTGLSNSYAKLGDVGLAAIPPREAFSKAKAAAMRALEIDDALAEAHTSLAHVHMHDYEWPGAGSEFRRALELNPNYATAHHWHAYYLMMTGRAGEALTEIAKALELDPLSLPINTDFGELLFLARQYDRAIEQLRQTLEMDDYYYQAHLVLARVYSQKGMFAEAVAEFFKSRELSGDSARPGLARPSLRAVWEYKRGARSARTVERVVEG